MAKIKFYKLKGDTVKGEEITSITRFDSETKESLLIKKQEFLKQQGITRIKSKRMLISAKSKESETNLESNL